ncbi:hypothetical protein B0H17DRAFT_1133441 [Mycena rosella]|uniref:Uncharacterized protein n=1 Tax=Mycena rosella TaxID=1033263 RepID=A0AAD7DJV1_MYCRO|nr:hypothetical protein B0H17DRAFT_1133441 [Mycena rosella]
MSSSSRSATGECKAHDKESGQECDCPQFQASEEDAEFCADCFHHRKHHLISMPGASTPKPGVKAMLAQMLLRPGRSTSRSSASTSRGKSSLRGVSSSTSSKTLLSNFSAANHEANLGMRPRDDTEGGSSKKRKAKRSRNTFKVSSILVISQGTEFVDGVLCIADGHDAVPNRVETQTAVLEGRAVLNLNDGFEMDRTWTHEDVVDALTSHLPLPFSHFHHIQQKADDNDEPAWRLATVVQKKIVISPVLRPDGSHLFYNKGNMSTGFNNSRLFIVARKPIPAELLREWAAPESKSFRDDGGDSNLPNGSPSPERIPCSTKRRLFSKSSSDEDFIPTKKGRGPPAANGFVNLSTSRMGARQLTKAQRAPTLSRR